MSSSFQWSDPVNYEDVQINVWEEYAKVYGVRETHRIYFNPYFSRDLYISWDVELPFNCEEKVFLSFDGGNHWLQMQNHSFFKIPTDSLDFFIIKQTLIMHNVHLLDLSDRPLMNWFSIEDLYSPNPCLRKMRVTAVHGSGQGIYTEPNRIMVVTIDKEKVMIS